MNKVLIIDDEIQSLEICQRKLAKNFYVKTADDPDKALKILKSNDFDCILTDLVMPSINGLEFVKKLQLQYPDIPLLVMSGKATVNMAVQAMKAGAVDFIEKPIMDLEILPVYVNKALKSKNIITENKLLKEQLSEQIKREDFIGNSIAVQKMMKIIQKVSRLNTTISIHGETGSGKEMIAKLIHRNSSRADRPFVPVNCGAIPDTLLESLLFGHKKGSFTGAVSDQKGFFEEAHNGTLFLDEIGETSTAFQIKLLRVLQEKKIRRVGGERDIDINVRIIAATNRNLQDEVNEGNFRKDLFYRLNVIKIHVPSLFERRSDIPLLANHFLKNFMKENNLSGYTLHKETLKKLTNYNYEGNIRELQNVIEHASAMALEKIITPEDLPAYIRDAQEIIPVTKFSIDYQKAKDEFGKMYFSQLLDEAKGNISEASRISGIARANIYSNLKKLNLMEIK